MEEIKKLREFNTHAEMQNRALTQKVEQMQAECQRNQENYISSENHKLFTPPANLL